MLDALVYYESCFLDVINIYYLVLNNILLVVVVALNSMFSATNLAFRTLF
jgi:hypothetical protein